jgi:dihydroflavonol-4-reductase
MTTLVTGGSGVVGGALVRHLVTNGAEVRALSRNVETDRLLTDLGASPVRGDILDAESLDRAMSGVELVYHVAGVNQMCVADPTPMIRANVDGSMNVIRAATTARARRVVYTSSAATLGEAKGVIADESATHRGWYLSEYERSKHLAELAVMAEPGIEIVSVNPSSVQGPGRATGTGKIILDVVRGRLPFLVDTRLSIVDIDDCARGHIAAAERGVPGERYILNSFTMTMPEAIAVLEHVLGHPLKVRFLPGAMAVLGGVVMESAAKARGRHPQVCREMVRTLRHGHAYDGAKARRDLGVSYTSAEDLLARLVAWFRSEGLLDG